MSWRGLPAPVAPLGEPDTSTGPAVWGIRFATPEHGFVFGDGLWVTTDGGEHWSASGYPGGAILSLEISDHQVLAVTARHGTDGPTGGQGWNDLGFTSARDGVVIHGHPYYGDRLGQLLLTDNGGLTWHTVMF